MLQALGMTPDAAALRTRKLIIPTANPQVRLLPVRAQDTPAFVACGAAQAGIAGRDVLAEKRMAEITCPLNLQFGACRLVIATTGTAPEAGNKPLMVATKYPHLAQAHFAGRGITANIIKLHGAIELAPLVGVADVVVDLAASGRTLRENGLVEQETIMQVSAMLILNRIAARRQPEVAALPQKMAACLAAHD